MHTIASKCKFCGVILTLDVDDDYEHDPQKLLPYASCNRCADLRVEKKKLEDAIRKNVITLAQYRKLPEDALSKIRKSLTAYTKEYTKLIAEWVNGVPIWESSIVDNIMQEPEQWFDVLSHCWKIHKH